MKILVCVKSVPGAELNYEVNSEGTGYEEGGLVFRANEYDIYAMEEAVRIKEKFGDVEITAVTVGPERAEVDIKKAMALGAQDGFRIDKEDARQADALSIASLIASWAGDINFDLILCGVMSDDMMRSQTGPMLAQLLGVPCATTVISEELSRDKKTITCERELEGGMREKVELPLPALLTIQSGINIQRYASLTNVLRVKKMEIPSAPADSLDREEKGEGGVRACLAESGGTCEFLEGHFGEIADQLIDKIRSRVHVL